MIPPDTLRVAEAAALIGVARQRVHQRFHQTDRPLAHFDAALPDAKARDIRIPTAAALAWRSEREAAGEPVGPLPPWAQPLPPHPPEVPDVPPVPTVIRGIGLHGFRPF